MKQLLIAVWAMMFCVTAQGANPQVEFKTNKGAIVIELYPEQAPETVSNFVGYVNENFYDGTIFHRVISGFMIQGGGFTEDYERKETKKPINNEADNGLKNTIGTVAMARTNHPHSATSQFFINVADNGFLDFRTKSSRGYGYAVFGKVVEGMDIVNRIASSPTGNAGPFPKDVPLDPVIIEQATLIGDMQ